MATRNIALKPHKSALLIIDLQRFCSVAGEGSLKHVTPGAIPEEYQYYFNRLTSMVVPGVQGLLKAFRSQRGKAEVIYTYIECLTKDGRDQSLDYKLTGFCVPKGSRDAEILCEIAPEEDEILIPKTACSVFNSTNIEYVLRNLGVEQLVVVGGLSNQCVESAVRDAADKGFLVTVVEDAIYTYSQLDHDQAIKNMRGFARICQWQDLVKEMEDWK